MSKLYDVEDYIDVFDNIVSSRTSGDQVIKILMKIKEKLDKSEKEDTEPDSYLEFCRLINKIKKYPCSPAIFILKNEFGNFDFYAYKNGVMACFDSLVSSESFLKPILVVM